ncbi:TetR family transcriptional regulator [Auraticoccus sp. F435]|uniref:TetR family transcriptional regulator n=1 Tax=Auraticoccus cholistanensis TaxID=2656650 RepID=A0A6A9V1P6_9ACTN|nr:TetR family transcriptional regulator [Auraticoccus cholistanensis]MVA77512.1 TetR family transcriptional regulator [Auraticoccus cholistanensis]
MGEANPRGLRDEKKRVTRHNLRLAALRLVDERGLEGTTTEEIAQAAGVSPRTFFNYFPTKESALVGVDAELAEAMLAAIRERPAGEPPLTVMREVYLQFAEVTAADRDLWTLRIQVARANPSLLSQVFGNSTKWDRRVAEAIAQRTGRDHHTDPYPALVASVANAARRSAVHRWAISDSEAPLSEAIAAAFDLLAAGLPEPPDSPGTATERAGA